MALTDNQKSATFIGWVPGVHGTLSPDMADPRNYMKALEALETRGYDYQINFHRPSEHLDVAISHYIQIGHGYWHDGGIKDILGDGDGATLAAAVVKALAALYDAEHPAPKEEG
jgi:hypothetical protein